MAPEFLFSLSSLHGRGRGRLGPEARSCLWDRVAERLPSPRGSSGPARTCASPHPAPAHTGQPLLPGEIPGCGAAFVKPPARGRQPHRRNVRVEIRSAHFLCEGPRPSVGDTPASCWRRPAAAAGGLVSVLALFSCLCLPLVAWGGVQALATRDHGGLVGLWCYLSACTDLSRRPAVLEVLLPSTAVLGRGAGSTSYGGSPCFRAPA